MPQFNLNKPTRAAHPFYALSDFAKSYVEAMFFTNGDCGDERENLLNDRGVEGLTTKSVEVIGATCHKFMTDNAKLINDCLDIDESDLLYSRGNPISEERLANCLWFSRQGHGVSATDWAGPGSAGYDLLEAFDNVARDMGESNVEVYRGWIHVRDSFASKAGFVDGRAPWVYDGDVNLENGGYFWAVENPLCDDFASVVEVIAESDIGGRRNVFLVKTGSLYMPDDDTDLPSALACCGIDPSEPLSMGDRVRALLAYRGFDSDSTELVQFGTVADWESSREEGFGDVDSVLRSNASLSKYVRSNLS